MVQFAVVFFLVAFAKAELNLGVSYLTVINNAASDVVDTRVTNITADQWGPVNAPQYNFQNVQIKSGDSVSRQADINLHANASHFDMELIYSDLTSEQFRINQQYVFGGSADFEHFFGDRYISYEKLSNHTLIMTILN